MTRSLLLVALAGACTAAKSPGDTGPAPAPPPDPCTLDLPLDYDAPMPFWDRSITAQLGPHPTAPMAGELVRPDGLVGELRLGLTWSPHPRDAVQWDEEADTGTPCSSVFSTTFEVGELVVDGRELTAPRAHGARLTSEGVVTVELTADAADVEGTILEPPSGRDAVCVWLRLLAVLPADPAQIPRWTVELWADEDARWSAAADFFPFAEGELAWEAAPR